MKTKRLGKGLEALIPQTTAEDQTPDSGVLKGIDVNRIHANPFQPRLEFDKAGLEELKNSIIENGVIQPITVRKTSDGYELIAGERRLRAVQDIGFEQVPAYIIEISSDDQMLEFALVENVQRENLNPIELAMAYQQLQKEHGLTQEEVAKKVGKDRTTIANFVRLLKLPKQVQDYLWKNDITMGHARTLMGLDTQGEQIHICKKVIKQGWSVRKLEEEVRKRVEIDGSNKTKIEPQKSAYFTEIEDKLRGVLGTKVKLKPSGKSGKVEILYFSEEDLERITELMYGLSEQ